MIRFIKFSIMVFFITFPVCVYGEEPIKDSPVEKKEVPLPPEALLTKKSKYHLFNPTPRELMRDFTTDRPDKTESPYSVDAGHFVFETDLVTYIRDRNSTTDTATYYVNLINLKLGITNSSDFQAIVESYVTSQSTVDGARTSNSGFGDITLRYKQNILGNEGGPVALGIMPFMKLPTNMNGIGNKKLEGGLIFPLATVLPMDFSLGMMLQYNRKKNEESDLFHNEWISSITIGHTIIGELAYYTELFSQSADEPEALWVATFDVGFTYKLGEDIQFDAGINVGLTDAADDLNPFVGLSMRY